MFRYLKDNELDAVVGGTSGILGQEPSARVFTGNEVSASDQPIITGVTHILAARGQSRFLPSSSNAGIDTAI